MSLLKEFSKDTIVYGLGRGIKKFIGLLLLPIYTRALAPADYGILDTLGTGIFFVTTFFNFGLDTASSYFFFQPREEDEKGKILFTVFIIRLLVIIPAVILSFFTKPLSVALFGNDTYSSIILITCLLIPANMLMSEQELVYRFYRNVWGYNVLTIVKSLVNIAAGILLVVQFKMGVFGAQMASLISTVIVVLVSLIFYTRKKYNYQFSFTWAKKMLRFGFPLIWAGMATWIYSVSDRFILLHYRSLDEIGFYSIGSTFSQPLGLINMAIQMSFGVLFFSIYNNDDAERNRSKELMTKVLYLYISVAAIITLFLSIYAYDIVSFVATTKYLEGIVVIPVLLISMIFAQMVEIIPVGITLSEKTWYFTWIVFVTAIVNAGLNILVIPRFGFLGASFTTLFAYLVCFVMSDLISKRFFNSGYSRLRIISFLIIVLLMAFYIPYLQIRGKVVIYPLIKAITLITGLLLPFLFRFVHISQLVQIQKEIVVFVNQMFRKNK
jgi:O-antigen/teichoic acid export membrane protein